MAGPIVRIHLPPAESPLRTGALRLVEHQDVRLDPALVDQPVRHLGRAVAGVNAGASVLLAAKAARDKAIARALTGRDAPFAGAVG